MPLYLLNDSLWFPPVEEAMEDGLLALGGDVAPDRLLLAYQRGIFPWYSDDLPLWWSPDPRFVLFPDELRIHKSMRTFLKNTSFHFTINQAFAAVLEKCSIVPRAGQDGTWLNEALQTSLVELHQIGWAHSAEVWQNNELVGGLYGIRVGSVFCGESMFSLASNASKFALIKYTEILKQQGVKVIDCQVYSEHLSSLGARMIDRKDFMNYINAVG